MVCISLQSLSDLCAIHIAYLMWTRRYVAENYSKKELFDELVHEVASDVRKLPLKKETAVILKQLEYTGKHLLSLLSLWVFAEAENSQKWLTGDILYECLILNGDGLINQRKTAERILSSRMLDNVFAFRFACINFLEKKVLKLWIFVKDYFLNKLILEGDEANSSRDDDFPLHFIDLNKEFNCFNMREYTYSKDANSSDSLWSDRDQLPFTTEREEVLFWISYCLSKENGISMKEIPHFLGYDFDWYTFSLEFAAFSGNVACFDYFRNFHDPRIEYDYEKIIRQMFYSREEDEGDVDFPCFDRQLPCLMFHYVLLNREEKVDLFRMFPSYMLFYFVQWPLSLTFLDNVERIWNLLKYDLAIFKILELFSGNYLPSINGLFDLPFCIKITGFYNPEHVARIWVSLWNLIPRSLKSALLDDKVLSLISISNTGEAFYRNFEKSGFKELLIKLFLTNGEAILQFYEKEYLDESLRNLAAKYIPKHFAALDNLCISLLSNQVMVKGIEQFPNEYKIEKKNAGPLHEIFLKYLKKILFLPE